MARYKSNVHKVTILPNNITLVPNQELDLDDSVDMTPYEKVGYVTRMDKVVEEVSPDKPKDEPKVDEKPAAPRKRGRPAGKAK